MHMMLPAHERTLSKLTDWQNSLEVTLWRLQVAYNSWHADIKQHNHYLISATMQNGQKDTVFDYHQKDITRYVQTFSDNVVWICSIMEHLSTLHHENTNMSGVMYHQMRSLEVHMRHLKWELEIWIKIFYHFTIYRNILVSLRIIIWKLLVKGAK